MPNTPAPDGALFNGVVWLNGKPVALDLAPHLKRHPRRILRDHLADQRAYIGRLTDSANAVEAFLRRPVPLKRRTYAPKPGA